MLIPCVIDAGEKKTTCLVDAGEPLKVELDNEEYGGGMYTGAVIALAAGLAGGDKEKVRDLLAAAHDAVAENIRKSGHAAKVCPRKREKKDKPVMQRVGKENAGKCVLVNAENEVYGILGTPTNYADSKGVRLCVGDLVTVDGVDHLFFGKLLPVALDEASGIPFVYGASWLCYPDMGEFDPIIKVTRVKNWYELCVGERLRDCGLTVKWRNEV